MIESSYLRKSTIQSIFSYLDDGTGERRLQSLGSNTSPPAPAPEKGEDRYEFVAFLIWYIFLVMCCVIPTCCAYHRRRVMEQRLAVHRTTMRQNSNNLFFLSSLQQQQHQHNPHRNGNSEQVQQERLAILREELKGTTMAIKEEHIVEPLKSNENTNTVVHEKSSNGDSAVTSVGVVDIENGDSMEDCGHVIQLPSVGVNADRTVPGVCTICLCPYEDGDQISWSTEESCQHAFHTDCIIPWLAKKEEPKCPICRQEFCATPVVSHDDAAFDIDLERESSFLHSFSQALAMSQFYRPRAGETQNTYEQTRHAITLQLTALALENQMRLEQAATTGTPVIQGGGSSSTAITGSTTNTNPRRNSWLFSGAGVPTTTAETSSIPEVPSSTTASATTNQNTGIDNPSTP